MKYRFYNTETATYTKWFVCDEVEPRYLAEAQGCDKFIGMADFMYFFTNGDGVELIIKKEQ